MAEIDADALADAIIERLRAVDDRPLLSTTGLADRLGISPRKAAALIYGESPAIPSVKVGGSRKIKPADVDEYVARLQESG